MRCAVTRLCNRELRASAGSSRLRKLSIKSGKVPVVAGVGTNIYATVNPRPQGPGSRLREAASPAGTKGATARETGVGGIAAGLPVCRPSICSAEGLVNRLRLGWRGVEAMVVVSHSLQLILETLMVRSPERHATKKGAPPRRRYDFQSDALCDKR